MADTGITGCEEDVGQHDGIMHAANDKQDIIERIAWHDNIGDARVAQPAKSFAPKTIRRNDHQHPNSNLGVNELVKPHGGIEDNIDNYE